PLRHRRRQRCRPRLPHRRGIRSQGCDLRAPVPPYQLGLAGRTRRNVRDTWLSFEEDTSASKLQSAPCCWKKFRVQDAKNFGWEINGDINYNWKKLLENKLERIVGMSSARRLISSNKDMFVFC
uniref:Uncharacterized protein n=1 Tax=Aegilops tauschii subsp. strangulata TaxID=200361 RepID=A0A453P283_AEGTS